MTVLALPCYCRTADRNNVAHIGRKVDNTAVDRGIDTCLASASFATQATENKVVQIDQGAGIAVHGPGDASRSQSQLGSLARQRLVHLLSVVHRRRPLHLRIEQTRTLSTGL